MEDWPRLAPALATPPGAKSTRSQRISQARAGSRSIACSSRQRVSTSPAVAGSASPPRSSSKRNLPAKVYAEHHRGETAEAEADEPGGRGDQLGDLLAGVVADLAALAVQLALVELALRA